ncbi:enoyl-CoA hydratase [Bacillus testis]|uniref:enoyl-CoA hydratase n=1 Tax=Bacillus testis TaxID=1622072 RepID=UPI00067EE6AD|nr:enoyl-CoA hydratase [Bacillus testis]
MAVCLLREQNELGIVTLTLNRPSQANALSRELLTELSEAAEDYMFDRSVRCMIITAAGDRIFSAGADLKERKGMDEPTVRRTVSLIGNTFKKIEQLPFPVIAALNGSAFGGGLELALACDLRVASRSGTYGLTETSLAIIPGAGGTQRLPRLIGAARAKELIFTAKRLEAQEAFEYGLFNQVASAEAVYKEAQALAEAIASNGPIAVRQAKRAIEAGLQGDLPAGLKIEELCYASTIPTRDRLEGLQAFAEKRKPVYKGE